MTKYFRSLKNPVFLIAEIGGNHEGDFGYAKELTSLAIESGVDAVKFQIYQGRKLVNGEISPDRKKHFERFELSQEQYEELAQICDKADVEFMASVWDREAMGWADPLIRIHKVGSGDFTCLPLIEILVSTGKPLILSTGLCSENEIRKTIEYIFQQDGSYRTEDKLALMQCTSSYPCPPAEANLAVITSLRQQYGVTVGYSDHTVGTKAIEIGHALGAEIVEKHFTDDRSGKQFRDHQCSITRDECKELIEKLRYQEELLGRKKKVPTKSELESDHVNSFRRSIYASKPISKGEAFGIDNMIVLRPKVGVCASKYHNFLGKSAPRGIAMMEPLLESDLI